MGIKRIVDTQFWNDDKVIDLFSPEDKLFMLYLLTNPHTTQLGVYAINKKNMAFELGYSVETITVLLERFERQYKIVKYSEQTKEIAIKNYLKHSIIKGGKPVEDCLMKEISRVKDKSLLQFVYDNIFDCETLNDTVKKILENLNINKNKNDNENDNDNDVSYHDTSTIRPRIVSIHQQVVDFYNNTCLSLSKVTAISDNRKKAINARLNTYSFEDIENVFIKAEASDFLKGKNDRDWQANFDWLMKDSNFAKVLDGNYDNKGQKQATPIQQSQERNYDFDRKYGTVIE